MMTKQPPRLSSEQLAQCLDTRVLSLILMPTERCNLRCVYCYETHEHGRMNDSTVSGIQALLTHRAPELSRVEIDWFGGEPLLARDIVTLISRHVTALGRAHPNLQYRGSMTTNGVLLTRDVLSELVDVGIRRYQISLDGDARAHDRTRITIRGQGTFEAIWANLIAARSSPHELNVALRVHLHAGNIESVSRLVDRLSNEFVGDKRFSVFIKPIARLGGPGNDALHMLTTVEAIEAVRRFEGLLEERGVFINHIDDDYICYASMANSLVIRANGAVSKCTVAFDNPLNDIGLLHQDGTMDVNQERFRYWLRGVLSDNLQVAGCPLTTTV